MSRIMATEMKYLWRVAGKTRRDCVRNERIIEEWNITTFKNNFEKWQLKWFGHVCKMKEDQESRSIMESQSTGKILSG